jgi:hypothetical protein
MIQNFDVFKDEMPICHIKSWLLGLIKDEEFNDLVKLYNPIKNGK